MAQRIENRAAEATCGTTTVTLNYSLAFGSNVMKAKVVVTGNWNNEFTTSAGGWGYNKQASVLVEYMNSLGIPNDGLHHLTSTMLQGIATYMEAHAEQDFIEDLIYLVRWDKTSNEVLFVLPTVSANSGCVMTYCRSTAHGEVSVDWLGDRKLVEAFDPTNEAHKASYEGSFPVFSDLYTNPAFGHVSRLVLKSKLLRAYTDIAWNWEHKAHRVKAAGEVGFKRA